MASNLGGNTLDAGVNAVQEFGANPTANPLTGAARSPALRPRRSDDAFLIVFSLPFDPARASN
jgi:hypothetical protein